jgi:hypothetical protein
VKRPSRPRMPRASRAGSILQQLLNAQGMEQKFREYRAWEVWEKVVGPQIAGHARPLRLREGVLEVRVDQPIWMQQLRLMAPEILQKLNRALGEELIRELYWRRGTLTKDELVEPSPPPARPLPKLTVVEQKRIDEATSALPDEELQSALTSLLTLQARLNKQREES